MLLQTAQDNPSFDVKILDMNAIIGEDWRTAEVDMNVETKDLPEGCVRRTVQWMGIFC